MRLFGIDVGTKRVGIAVGDTDTRIASPLLTIPHDKYFWEVLSSHIATEGIEGIVVGMPRSLAGGTEGEAGEMVRTFLRELAHRVTLPVFEEDERFSSKLADAYTDKRADRDAVAASIILQSYFDRIKNQE